LQCANSALDRYYILVSDIDATDTATWNGGAGFTPIGPSGTSKFIGGFDGMGHAISHLFIYRPDASVGLFGETNWQTRHIRNVGLADVDITGGYMTGGLAGVLVTADPVENVYVQGKVTGGAGNSVVGGLASQRSPLQDPLRTRRQLFRDQRFLRRTGRQAAAAMRAKLSNPAAGRPDYRLVAYEAGPGGYRTKRQHPEIDEYYGK